MNTGKIGIVLELLCPFLLSFGKGKKDLENRRKNTFKNQFYLFVQVAFVYLKAPNHDFSRLALAIIAAARESQISVRTVQVYRQPYYYENRKENFSRNPFLDIVRDTYKEARSMFVIVCSGKVVTYRNDVKNIIFEIRLLIALIKLVQSIFITPRFSNK